MNARWITCRLLFGLLSFAFTGCLPALPFRHLALHETSVFTQPHLELVQHVEAAQEPATLQELLDIAVRHHPDVRAARARVEVARGRMIQAGLYPNPSIGPNFSQLGASTNRLGEAGARLTLNVVTANKIGIAKAAAERGVEAADWHALTRWHDVVTRVRLAYYELLTARREESTMDVIIGFSDKALKDAERLEKAGAGNRPDVLRAKVEYEQNVLRKEVSARRVEAAEQNLLNAIGRPTLALNRLTIDPRVLEQSPPEYDWNLMLACLRESSTELQEARALIAQQEKLFAKAKADVIPDVNVALIPFYDSTSRELRGQVILQAQIPLWDRNQGNIHAAMAELDHSMAFERQLELRLTERLTVAYARYQSARKQADAYQKIIVPKAEESLNLMAAAFGGDKKYDYTALLQAEQVLSQARLAQTQALGELWRSVIEIAGILQQERLTSGCAVRPLNHR